MLRFMNGLNSVLNELLVQQPVQIYWVSRKKAAELYDVSTRTILNWKKEGLLQSKEINGKQYYSIIPLLKDNN